LALPSTCRRFTSTKIVNKTPPLSAIGIGTEASRQLAGYPQRDVQSFSMVYAEAKAVVKIVTLQPTPKSKINLVPCESIHTGFGEYALVLSSR
jgi:hypothetical protein